MNIERLTAKYTGHRIEVEELAGVHRRGGLAAALAEAVNTAVEAVAATEAELTRLEKWISDDCSKAWLAVDAETMEQAPKLNPLGELQARGPRFDAVIALRDDRIAHLCTLVRLWQHLPHDSDTPA